MIPARYVNLPVMEEPERVLYTAIYWTCPFGHMHWEKSKAEKCIQLVNFKTLAKTKGKVTALQAFHFYKSDYGFQQAIIHMFGGEQSFTYTDSEESDYDCQKNAVIYTTVRKPQSHRGYHKVGMQNFIGVGKGRFHFYSFVEDIEETEILNLTEALPCLPYLVSLSGITRQELTDSFTAAKKKIPRQKFWKTVINSAL